MRAASLLFGLTGLLFGNVVEACRIDPGPPSTKIDPALVAFVGVVDSYAMPRELYKGRPEAYGLRVRVTESAIAAQVDSMLDVYPISHGPDCKALPVNFSMVQKDYHPGDTISVVGRSESGASEFFNVVRAFNFGQQAIGKVPADYPRTEYGTMDFAKVLKASRPDSYSADYWQRLYDTRAFQYYEYFKSLALIKAGNTRAKESIKVAELENVRYYYAFGCMIAPFERKAFIDLVRDAQLSEPAQARVLAEVPSDTFATGYLRTLKGTVFDGYCEVDQSMH